MREATIEEENDMYAYRISQAHAQKLNFLRAKFLSRLSDGESINNEWMVLERKGDHITLKNK